MFDLGLILNLEWAKPNFASLEVSLAQAKNPNSLISDGTYLYGQSSIPEQIGKEYLVFNVNKGKVIGAIYMPQSEFNCFFGSFNSQQMNVSIVNPYDNALYPHSIALQSQSPVATTDRASGFVGLQGYQPVSTISNNDRNILAICFDKHD